MHHVEVEECLESMQIVVDTREQPSERSKRRYEAFGCPWYRHTLGYGDYTYNFTLPTGELLFNDETINGHVVIERKMSLVELSSNFCQNRKRFENEFDKANAAGAKVYLLVENATYENLYNGRYKTNFHPNAFTASLWAWCARYDVTPVFCKAETSGRIIHDILCRELRERLVRGDYG